MKKQTARNKEAEDTRIILFPQFNGFDGMTHAINNLDNTFRYNGKEDRLLKERELSIKDRVDISLNEYNEMKERIRYLDERSESYRRAFHKFYVAMRNAGVPENVIEAIFDKDCKPEVFYNHNFEHLGHKVSLRFVVSEMELKK